MSKIIAITNQRGGSGKTTTAIQLGMAFSQLEKKTLLIDLDPQKNATLQFEMNLKRLSRNTIYQVLTGENDITASISSTINPNLQIIQGNSKLIDLEISSIGSMILNFKENLISIEEKYDYILLDCPPDFSCGTLIALATANSFIIPLQCMFHEEGFVTYLIAGIEKIKATFNPTIFLLGILFTMVDNKRNLVMKIRSENEGMQFFETEIPYCTQVSGTFELGYQALAAEIIASS